jgi:hypothetical protein
MMPRLFADGAICGLVLAVMAVEAAVLWRRAGGSRAAALDLLLAVAPGAALVLALRAALTGEGWVRVAFWLALSFPAHLADMARRGFWRSARDG